MAFAKQARHDEARFSRNNALAVCVHCNYYSTTSALMTRNMSFALDCSSDPDLLTSPSSHPHSKKRNWQLLVLHCRALFNHDHLPTPTPLHPFSSKCDIVSAPSCRQSCCLTAAPSVHPLSSTRTNRGCSSSRYVKGTGVGLQEDGM